MRAKYYVSRASEDSGRAKIGARAKKEKEGEGEGTGARERLQIKLAKRNHKSSFCSLSGVCKKLVECSA